MFYSGQSQAGHSRYPVCVSYALDSETSIKTELKDQELAAVNETVAPHAELMIVAGPPCSSWLSHKPLLQ
jgi:hypothetical protein